MVTVLLSERVPVVEEMTGPDDCAHVLIALLNRSNHKPNVVRRKRMGVLFTKLFR